MAEMKEKRASMAPHKLNDEESIKAATEKPNPNASQTGMFSGVKLRWGDLVKFEWFFFCSILGMFAYFGKILNSLLVQK